MATEVDRSDADLVRSFKQGDKGAFEELHRRYVGAIYRLVIRTLGDGLLAEDIAQETFIKSLRTLDRVDESFNFGGWIHTVAQNLCRDELRRKRRDPRLDQKDNERDIMYELPATSRESNPIASFEARELRRQVWSTAQKLPEKYRLVLTLRELQGFSYRRIARAMNMSESAVETLLYRARLRFKEEFVNQQGGHDLDCSEVQPMLAPYLAGKLRVAQAEAVRDHLAHCVKCSRKLVPRRKSVPRALNSEVPDEPR